MIAITPQAIALPKQTLPKVTWDRLPDDFVLPDDPVDNQLQPLLAEALREPLELAGLVEASTLIATNFGIWVWTSLFFQKFPVLMMNKFKMRGIGLSDADLKDTQKSCS